MAPAKLNELSGGYTELMSPGVKDRDATSMKYGRRCAGFSNRLFSDPMPTLKHGLSSSCQPVHLAF